MTHAARPRTPGTIVKSERSSPRLIVGVGSDVCVNAGVATVIFIVGILVRGIVPYTGETERYWLAQTGRTIARFGIGTRVIEHSMTLHSWITGEWAYALAVAWSADRGVYPSVAVLTALAACVPLLYVLHRCGVVQLRGDLAVVAALVAGYLTMYRFQLRAEPFGVLGVLAMIVLVRKRTPLAMLAVAGVAAVGINIHGSILLGEAVVTVWVVVDAVLRREARLAVWLPLVWLACLCTPYGVALPLQEAAMAHSWMSATVAEWQPTLVVEPEIAACLLVPLIGVAITRRIRRETNLADASIYLVTIVVASTAVRHTAIAAQVGFVEGLALVAFRGTRDGSSDAWARVTRRYGAALAAAIAVALVLAITQRDLVFFLRNGAERDPFGVVVARNGVTTIGAFPIRNSNVACFRLPACNVALQAGATTWADGRVDALAPNVVALQIRLQTDNNPARAIDALLHAGVDTFVLDRVLSPTAAIRLVRIPTASPFTLYRRRDDADGHTSTAWKRGPAFVQAQACLRQAATARVVSARSRASSRASATASR